MQAYTLTTLENFTSRVKSGNAPKPKEMATAVVMSYSNLREGDKDILPTAAECLTRMISIMHRVESSDGEINEVQRQLSNLYRLRQAFQDAEQYMYWHNGEFPIDKSVEFLERPNSRFTNMIELFSDASSKGVMQTILDDTGKVAKLLYQQDGTAAQLGTALASAISGFCDGINYTPDQSRSEAKPLSPIQRFQTFVKQLANSKPATIAFYGPHHG